MSNKEIEKQAEELIEKHKMHSYGEEGSITERKCAIGAAIVSCEFAIQGFSVVNKGLDEVYQDIRTPKGISSLTEPYKHSLEQIKAYLEGLL